MSDERAKKPARTRARIAAAAPATEAAPAAAAPAGAAATDAASTAAEVAAKAAAAEEKVRTNAAADAAAAAAANADAAGTDSAAAPAADQPRSTRQRLAEDALGAARAGAKGVQTVSLAGLRTVMPLIEVYAARRAGDEQEADQPGRLGLTLGEESVLKTAAQKAMVELLEVTSRTDPIMEGAPAYTRMSEDGRAQTPSLVQLLSVAAAANRYFERGDNADEAEEAQLSQSQSVAYVAVAPGEYHAVQEPLTPTQVRRSAMRERSYNTPQPAMLVYSAQGYSTAPATGHSHQSAAMAGAGRQLAAYRAPQAASCCGGTGGGKAMTFPPARYDKDGKCAPLFDISCETRWRVRECFKVGLCDLLRCLGEELCEDGRFAEDPDLGACLERFICSILTCLPEAICPTGGEEICCLPADAVSCGCNFAVGE